MVQFIAPTAYIGVTANGSGIDTANRQDTILGILTHPVNILFRSINESEPPVTSESFRKRNEHPPNAEWQKQ